jgi:hypothetical protein
MQNLNIGDVFDYKDFPELWGDELNFEQLMQEPSTSLLLMWHGAFVGSNEADCDRAYVCQVERVTDEEDPELASVLIDTGEKSPTILDFEDMEEPEDVTDADRMRTWNKYTRIWRVRRGSEAAPTGAAPEAGETALVEAAPAVVDALTLAQTLHQRIVKDAQLAAETLWDMCSAIKEMRDGKHYKALLYANFEGYCEEALGMSRAQAYRYITIAEGMTAENVASLQQIGMTKLALLASVTEEQREAIAATVDVESTTVRELKAQIEALKHQADGAEKSRQDAEARAQKWYDEAQQKAEDLNAAKTKLKSAETVIEGKQHIIDAKEARAEHYRAKEASLKADIAQLQDRITELESRPVEVAVQTDDAALEQLRAEHRAEVAELEAEIDRAEARADGYGECKALMTVAKDTLHRIALYLLHHPDPNLKYKVTKMVGDAMKEINCCTEEEKA